jgi:2-polyprenyl-3-methyl-5-hydroxy-6-metoxy-1,4-benzoquinol methylase
MEALRKQYEQHGVEGYYKEYGAGYRNPHESVIKELVKLAVEQWHLNTESVLDLACGSGEVTLALYEVGAKCVEGIDPYTHEAYKERTKQTAKQITFEDVARGALSKKSYSLIVCSFALHLIEKSKLHGVLFQLSLITPNLLILTPHKRPVITTKMGWHLEKETELSRIKARLYRSQQLTSFPDQLRQ